MYRKVPSVDTCREVHPRTGAPCVLSMGHRELLHQSLKTLGYEKYRGYVRVISAKLCSQTWWCSNGKGALHHA